MLIRWIDKAGDCHDNDWEDEEYVERGDKYWLNSIAQLE
jgi:serine/threonine-protein kinase